MAITLRNVKNAPLTHAELDENFSYILNTYQDYFYKFVNENLAEFTPDSFYHKYSISNFQSPLTINLPINTPQIGTVLILKLDIDIQKLLSWNAGYNTSLVSLPSAIDKVTEVILLYDSVWFVIGVL